MYTVFTQVGRQSGGDQLLVAAYHKVSHHTRVCACVRVCACKWCDLVVKFATNISGAWWPNKNYASGAMWSPKLVQVTESISGSVVFKVFFGDKFRI